MFQVKEIYYTLQGEGARTGRPAVFCRFTGCNLWTGREKDREKAVCNFCDTDFVGVDGPGGGKFNDSKELLAAISNCWPKDLEQKYVVLTGGEPALQINQDFIGGLHNIGFEVAIETNGTLPIPSNIDWVTVSPKSNSVLKVESGDELKLVFPQEGVDPRKFQNLPFKNFFLQPLDGEERTINTQKTLQYCLENPLWNLSLQSHKYIGIR
ncbi:MAG: 7-carboxy-7-deazaguanine synthase [Pseudomonadota bacterium]|nr:7-carboxy-7-deazaguanine synthase [Pseudomonadota bacterium]|tara:strand:+ start:19324 stop:19953 length:630 start_codon:yes stop_codon:yes gene_type:complete